jgi:hypothetical protein
MRPGGRLDSKKESSTSAGELEENGAGDETRTRDVLLGKEVLYH